jgi:hypothetical protein
MIHRSNMRGCDRTYRSFKTDRPTPRPPNTHSVVRNNGASAPDPVVVVDDDVVDVVDALLRPLVACCSVVVSGTSRVTRCPACTVRVVRKRAAGWCSDDDDHADTDEVEAAAAAAAAASASSG